MYCLDFQHADPLFDLGPVVYVSTFAVDPQGMLCKVFRQKLRNLSRMHKNSKLIQCPYLLIS